MDRIVPKSELLQDRIIEKELSYLIVGSFYETYNESCTSAISWSATTDWTCLSKAA